MKISRRDMLRVGAGTGAALLLGDLTALAQSPAQITRTIPSSGEAIPAVGLGSARTFSRRASADERGDLKEVLGLFHELGGTVFDTAPTYGLSESVAGDLVQELGIENDVFFATKISTGGGRISGVRQQEESMRLWGRDTIDLNQVHNLRGVQEHLPTIRQAKEEGRTRYVGVTISRFRQFGDMEQVMLREPSTLSRSTTPWGSVRLRTDSCRWPRTVVSEWSSTSPITGAGCFVRCRAGHCRRGPPTSIARVGDSSF